MTTTNTKLIARPQPDPIHALREIAPGWATRLSWTGNTMFWNESKAAPGLVVGEPVALTVPAEVMEAAQDLCSVPNHAVRQDAMLIRDWLKSIQGAGHGQG